MASDINACGPVATFDNWVSCDASLDRTISEIAYIAQHDGSALLQPPLDHQKEVNDEFLRGFELTANGPGFDTDLRVTLAVSNAAQGIQVKTFDSETSHVLIRTDPYTAIEVARLLHQQGIPDSAVHVVVAAAHD